MSWNERGYEDGLSTGIISACLSGYVSETRRLVDKAKTAGVSEKEILAAADHSYQKERPGSVDML